jgi:hypothetical protein
MNVGNEELQKHRRNWAHVSIDNQARPEESSAIGQVRDIQI